MKLKIFFMPNLLTNKFRGHFCLTKGCTLGLLLAINISLSLMFRF